MVAAHCYSLFNSVIARRCLTPALLARVIPPETTITSPHALRGNAYRCISEEKPNQYVAQLHIYHIFVTIQHIEMGAAA